MAPRMTIEHGTAGQHVWHRKTLLRLAGCGLIAILIAWQIAIRQLSRITLQADDPATALRVYPNSAPALSALAARELADQRPASSDRLATRALRSAVLSPLALRSLLIADQFTGKTVTSRDLPSAAGSLGWRDGATQIALFALDVQAGRMSAAADRLDAVGRTSGQPSVIFPVIDSWLQSNEFRREIMARLSRDPPWRGSYLTSLGQLAPAAVLARQQLATALPHRDRDQERTELSPYVYWLLGHGHFAGAYDLWRARLAQRTMGNSRLYDGGFRGTGQSGPALPFEWKFIDLAGASAVAVDDNGLTGLQVDTDGTAEGNLVEQRLVLPAGSYHFTIDMNSTSERALDVFQWTLSCGPMRTPIYGRDMTSTRDRPRPGMVRISFSFDVPVDKCPLQFVDLSLARPAVPENMVAFFTGARIQ